MKEIENKRISDLMGSFILRDYGTILHKDLWVQNRSIEFLERSTNDSILLLFQDNLVALLLYHILQAESLLC